MPLTSANALRGAIPGRRRPLCVRGRRLIGNWRRLKVCHNARCHEVFFDQSKNNSRTWRQATRTVMVLLSLHGLAPAQIAALLDCRPATERRWIDRFNREGAAGLAGRPRCGRPGWAAAS